MGKDSRLFLKRFLEYWRYLLIRSARATGGMVDMRGRFREVAYTLIVLALVGFGILSNWIPDSVIQAVKGDAWATVRLALLIIGVVVVEMFFIFLFRIMFIEPVNIYKIQMEIIERLEAKERLAKAEGIIFQSKKGTDAAGNNWVGVSVANDEKNSTLLGSVFTLESVEGLSGFQNSIVLHKRGKLTRPRELSPGGTPSTFDIAFTRNGKATIESLDRETFLVPDGEYTIKTRLTGAFYHKPSDIINPRDDYWLLTVGPNNALDLMKIEKN